jgi:hypothetical protein
MAKHSGPVRHSRGVSLANRGAGSHFYRDETAAGERRILRRRARTLTKRETRAIVAEELTAA